MSEHLINSAELPKGLSIEACVKKADELIAAQGVCLFLLDIINSRQHPDRVHMRQRLIQLADELNERFVEHLPENNLAHIQRHEAGFVYFFGDSTWAGIDNSGVIPPIAEYAQTHYPDIPLRFGVAKDGHDREGMRTVK